MVLGLASCKGSVGWMSKVAPPHDWQLILGTSFELSWDCPSECPQEASHSVVTEKPVSPGSRKHNMLGKKNYLN